MDEVKCYLDLKLNEKNELFNFVNRIEDKYKTIEEIENMFNSRENGYGLGSLIFLRDKKVIGSIQIILEVCEKLQKIYIYSIEIREDIADKKEVLSRLLKSSIEKAKKYNPKNIFLGVKKDYIELIETLGYKIEYYSVLMKLENKKTIDTELKLIDLNDSNKEEYREIINKSFSDMPHGTFHYKEDIEKYIKISSLNRYFFIVTRDNKNIGFLNVEINNNIGIFDIGLCHKYREKGYGKELLETAIKFLLEKSIENIQLIVIKKNKLAYNMYTKRGFKEKEVLNYWLEIKF